MLRCSALLLMAKWNGTLEDILNNNTEKIADLLPPQRGNLRVSNLDVLNAIVDLYRFSSVLITHAMQFFSKARGEIPLKLECLLLGL